MSTTTTKLEDAIDIRDVPMGGVYFVITEAARGCRCVMHPVNPMFQAAWLDRKEAKRIRDGLGTGFTVVKCVKR